MALHQVKVIPCSFRAADGRSVDLKLKACIYSDASVLFEVRRIVVCIILDRKSLDLHRLMKRDFQPWVEFLRNSGYDVATHIVPGRKVLEASGAECDMDNARKEWQVSIIGLITLLWHLANCRRKADRNGAACMWCYGSEIFEPTAQGNRFVCLSVLPPPPTTPLA